LVAAGLVVQAIALAAIASPGRPAGAALVGGAVLAGLLARAAWTGLGARGRAALAMLAWGGLGMTVGWWADLGFASAAARFAAAAPPAGAFCGFAPEAGAGVGHPQVVSWMNAGMLALGIAGLRVVHAPRARRGAAAACAAECAAMLLGMHAAAWLAGHVAAALAPPAAVVTTHALMNAGMLAGMVVAAPWRHARAMPLRLAPLFR